MRDEKLSVGDERYLRAPRPTRAASYDAFVSYSHAVDGRLAPVFQRELERFAKPWYRVRSARVFRDDASSAWVNREATWWLEHTPDPVRHLLIVLTAGDLAWDEAGTAFTPSSVPALPPVLRGAFTEEPRWVDLRWLRGAEQLDKSNPRLRDCVADVAAAIRGADKDLIIGEHIRQHRRALRLARSGVTPWRRSWRSRSWPR